MNQYQNMLEFYNYSNNNYNQPIYTENSDKTKLYDPYQGYIRGNMFKNLYNPYKNEPINLNFTSDKDKMLLYLDSIGFAAHDINLYLDIYPDDKNMIALFNNYRIQANELLNEYQNKYGPLLVNSDADNKYPWAWIDSPWPWEKN